MGYSLRQRLGAAVIDWPRFEIGLRRDWVQVRNRRERLRVSPDGRGVACQWQWTSDLHVAKVFPSLAMRLLNRAMRDWPISFADAPHVRHDEVQISFVVGHRGRQRVPHLLRALATIAAQRDVTCECIVVEQSNESEVAEHLPRWVRYVHTPLPVAEMPYCRSWAFNVGARAARGKILVFHDNDMLVPQAYASELWARGRGGYEVINLKRFVFYLNEAHSLAVCEGERRLASTPAEAIVQNAESGGSVAISRDAFFSIGGYDESFVGWGGEDNEFWDRALTRKVWPFGYLPIVHLWHAPQPDKQSRIRAQQYFELASIAPEKRITKLAQRRFGDVRQMDPPWMPGRLSE